MSEEAELQSWYMRCPWRAVPSIGALFGTNNCETTWSVIAGSGDEMALILTRQPQEIAEHIVGIHNRALANPHA